MGAVVELKPSTIAKLELNPGDIVVVRSSENIPIEVARQWYEVVKDAVGAHKVLVLTPNLSISVLSKT